MHAEMATVAGNVSQANEDWVGVTPTAIAVLDGLTAPRDLDEPGCQHGVPWYVGQLGPALLARLSDSTASLQDCLSSAIADVAARHCFCDLTSPGAPQSTVALVRVRGDELEWLVLADSVIVVDLHGELRVISDDRVERAAQVQRDDALRSPVGTAEHDQSVRRLIQQQRSVRNQPGGYWVAAADPAVAHEALTGSAHLSKVRSVAVLSDGAARLVEFGLAGWDQVLSTLAEAGPQSLINEIRRVEATDLRGDHWPRYKTSDDATAVYARF